VQQEIALVADSCGVCDFGFSAGPGFLVLGEGVGFYLLGGPGLSAVEYPGLIDCYVEVGIVAGGDDVDESVSGLGGADIADGSYADRVCVFIECLGADESSYCPVQVFPLSSLRQT